MSIKINDISFTYKKNNNNVINNLSLNIKEGSINVLLGLNGCGKTTLLKLIASLYNPNEGSIKIDNYNLNDLSYSERSKLIGYVSQLSSSLSDVLVKDYITFGMVNSIKFYKAPSENQIDKAKKVAKLFNIEKLLDKTLGELSGGERQMVSIVSSILQDSKYILLDEPTSALDLKNQNKVLSILKKINKENKKTIILTSHNPNHALFLSSNVYLMNKGTIVNEGKANKLITKNNLKEIYGNNIALSKELKYKEISFK